MDKRLEQTRTAYGNLTYEKKAVSQIIGENINFSINYLRQFTSHLGKRKEANAKQYVNLMRIPKDSFVGFFTM